MPRLTRGGGGGGADTMVEEMKVKQQRDVSKEKNEETELEQVGKYAGMTRNKVVGK